MEKKTKVVETFLIEVEEAVSLQGDTCPQKLKALINKWKRIVVKLCSSKGNYTEVVRNLHHLKLTIQWIENIATCDKRIDTNLTVFFQQLTEYVEIEIKCIRLKRFNTASNLPETKSNKTTNMTWTENKCSLVELIYALNQTACINNGKVTLKELISFFSNMFNTNLPNFHSTINKMIDRNGDVNRQYSRSFFWIN